MRDLAWIDLISDQIPADHCPKFDPTEAAGRACRRVPAQGRNQSKFGMKVQLDVDTDPGLIHSVITTAANVHDLTPSGELMHGEEAVFDADAGYQGITKMPRMAGKRRALPNTKDGRQVDLIETARAHVRAKGELPFRMISLPGRTQRAASWSRGKTPEETQDRSALLRQNQNERSIARLAQADQKRQHR